MCVHARAHARGPKKIRKRSFVHAAALGQSMVRHSTPRVNPPRARNPGSVTQTMPKQVGSVLGGSWCSVECSWYIQECFRYFVVYCSVFCRMAEPKSHSLVHMYDQIQELIRAFNKFVFSDSVLGSDQNEEEPYIQIL